jgi:Peptidase family M23
MKLIVALPVLIAFLVGALPAHAWTWPVAGPVLEQFRLGGDPYAGGQHRGVDVGASPGAAVRAPAPGVVSFAGTTPRNGRTLTIVTPDGYAVTLLHLGSIAVARGGSVEEGAAVGAVGPSGEAEHDQGYVHLGVRVASDPHGYVDPQSLLPPRPAPPAEEARAPEPAEISGDERPAEAPDEQGSVPAEPDAEGSQPNSVGEAASQGHHASEQESPDQPGEASPEPGDAGQTPADGVTGKAAGDPDRRAGEPPRDPAAAPHARLPAGGGLAGKAALAAALGDGRRLPRHADVPAADPAGADRGVRIADGTSARRGALAEAASSSDGSAVSTGRAAGEVRPPLVAPIAVALAGLVALLTILRGKVRRPLARPLPGDFGSPARDRHDAPVAKVSGASRPAHGVDAVLAEILSPRASCCRSRVPRTRPAGDCRRPAARQRPIPSRAAPVPGARLARTR